MKQFIQSRISPALWTAAAAFLLATAACNDDDNNEIKTFSLNVKLEYPDGYAPQRDVAVRLRKSNADNVDEAKTDAGGAASFTVLAGIYEAAVSETRAVNGYVVALNGVKSNIAVTDAWKDGDTVSISLTESKTSQLVIKELYVGGNVNPAPDGGEVKFQRDPYMIIYNNSSEVFSADNLSFGHPLPWNSSATNNFIENGELIYKDAGWIPCAMAAWSVQGNLRIEPGKQVVIAMNSANDHTLTYSNSVNLANPEYYVPYDIDAGFNQQLYHPSPSDVIPESHYLKAYRVPEATGTAWTFSVNSPAFFIFIPDTPLADFINDIEANRAVFTGKQYTAKIPREWVIEGIEVFVAGNSKNQKRLTPDIDGGYVEFLNEKGYTLYRNVDKEATEAIAENAGKLVYNYSLGTANEEGGTTDPSGVDAEASLKNGARIIYKDTNNSTADFHQRQKASLRN